MKLPKIDLPLFEITIPSSNTKVNCRPFTVKEEKVLLVAQESKELNQVILAIKQIINNCCEDVDVEKLALFDLEYLLLALRSKSVSNNAKFNIKDPETKETVELELDLDNIIFKKPEDHDSTVVINDDAHMIMRYPTINEIYLLQAIDSDQNKIFDVMISCIDKIVNGDEVYQTEDFTKEEIYEFVDGLPGTSIAGIQKFFETMPSLRHELHYTNSNGKEQTFIMEGLDTFFL